MISFLRTHPGTALAWGVFAIQCCAAAGYAVQRDWKHGLYWALCAGLTAIANLMKG